MPRKKAATAPPQSSPKISIERILPAAVLDRDALRDIAEIMEPWGSQTWKGERRGTTVEASTYDGFVEAASHLEALDELSIQAGRPFGPEGAWLDVSRFRPSFRVVSSSKARPEMERTAGKVVNVCRLHRRALYSPVRAFVDKTPVLVAISLVVGFLVDLLLLTLGAPDRAAIGYSLAALVLVYVVGAWITFQSPVKVVLVEREPVRRTSWGTVARSFVLAILASLIAGAFFFYLAER